LVDAKSVRTEYANALAVVFGAYATMQRDSLETAMRDIYFETLGQPEKGARAADPSRVSIRYVRPAQPLTTDVDAFAEQHVLDAMFAQGERDGAAGFAPYAWETFQL
jgi:hypothetical protein